jgi:hypothetical protein
MKSRRQPYNAAAGANVFPDPASPAGRTKSASKTEAPPGHELKVNMKFPRLVLLDGMAFSLPQCGLAVLAALNICPGECFSSEDLVMFLPFLKGKRIDRIIRQMPQAIQRLIEIREGREKAYKLDKSVRIGAGVPDETAKRLHDELSLQTRAARPKVGGSRPRSGVQ